METSHAARAIQAARAAAHSVGLPALEARVLHNSNKLTLRLMPCDVVARITRADPDGAWLELERAQRLHQAGCPVGAVVPGLDPVVHLREEFAVTLWAYYPPAATSMSAADYATALERLHHGMSRTDLATPHFTDRLAEAAEVAAEPELSPELTDAERRLLAASLADASEAIGSQRTPEQLLHGEPHPGNVIASTSGARFIDFETVCRGPIEFDLAHVPAEVSDHYPNVNRDLLDDCRRLVLAMVAAWRWRIGDEFPGRERWGRALLHTLTAGPPWPTLDAVGRDGVGGG